MVLQSIINLPPRRWRVFLFKGVSFLQVLFLLILFGGAFAPLEPFGIRLMADLPDYDEQIHRWHQAEWGAMVAFLFAGPLIVLLHRPAKKPLLMQFYATAILLFYLIMLVAPNSQETYAFLARTAFFCLLPVLFYPYPKALIPTFGSAHSNKPLLLLAAIFLFLLAPVSFEQWQLQAGAFNEDTAHHHYANNVALEILLVMGACMVAFRAKGSKTLAAILAVTLIYLGVAAMVASNQPDSWGIAGGLLCIAGGCIYAIVALFEENNLHTVGAPGNHIRHTASERPVKMF